MKKLILTLTTAIITAVSANAQLLYKISGKQQTGASYIIGTYHLADISFVDSISGIKEAMNETQQVYGELDMADMMKPENLQKMQEAMMMSEGQTLQSLLTSDELGRLNAYMSELMGFDLSNPMVAQQMERMSPQALLTQLTMFNFMKRHPNFNLQQQFDSYFQNEALKAGKHVGGLETVDLQINVLFKSTPIERQKTLLMCAVDNKEFTDLMTDNIVEAFYSQNLQKLEKAVNEKQNNQCDSSPEENNTLIYNRNANWAKLMPEIMSAKPTLFVVGAAHLPGERGVLQLLRDAGYTVEGME